MGKSNRKFSAQQAAEVVEPVVEAVNQPVTKDEPVEAVNQPVAEGEIEQMVAEAEPVELVSAPAEPVVEFEPNLPEPESELPQSALDAQEGMYIDQLAYWQGVEDAKRGIEPVTVIERRLIEVQERRNASLLEELRRQQQSRERMARAAELAKSSTPEAIRQRAQQAINERKAQLQAKLAEKGVGQPVAAGAAQKALSPQVKLDKELYTLMRSFEDKGQMSKNKANGGLMLDLKLSEEQAAWFKERPVGKVAGSKWSAFCWHLEYLAGGEAILRVDKVYTRDVNSILSAYLAKDAAAKELGHPVSTSGEAPEGLLLPQEHVDAVLALKKG